MASYIRQSTFSDGDTITAALFNNEFNQLVNAFNVSSGHTHDGSTTGDGGPISNLFSNALVFGTNAESDIAITFNAASNDGVLTWKEDEDYFEFSDDLLIATTEKIQFRDTAIYINSSADGQLDLVADTEIQIAATTIDMNGAADISGNLAVGGNLTVTGNATISGNLTFGDAASDTVAFSADVASNLLPSADNTYDLGASGSEWKDLYVDGVAYVDAINFNGTAITSTAAELNILDGVTSTASELNILDGVTSTAAELNILDGVTATTAELNILDGVTSTAAELNILDGVTSTAAELNILDGVTASATDINLIDGITNGTVIASKAIITDSNKDITGGRNITISGELDAATLDISGDADIDGTLEADAITIGGVTLAETISDTVGAMVSSNTETNITVTYEDSDNTLDFVIGTLNQDTTGTADNITVSANNSTDETVYPIFVDGATGSQGAESDTGLTYNPSSGNLTIGGQLAAATLDISGDVDVDGTLEADAITVNGTTLAETISDTIGAMVTSNTESGITVAYDDSDNTLDFTVGTLNQDTTGTAATVTGAAQSNITSLGTLTTLTVDNVIINGSTIGHTGDTDLITVASGVVTVAGELDATSLDISGDIDVDGTTNLDVVDIDGAVDMASTLQVDGAITSSAGATITVADNSDNLTIVSTDADATTGPNVNFYRNSSSPADNDHLGEIRFTGRNDNSQDVIYSNIETRIKDASDGTEDGYFDFETMLNGTLQSRLLMNEAATIVNEDSLDIDFRVESNGQTYALFVDGGLDNVGIGYSSKPTATLQGLNILTGGGNGGIQLNREVGGNPSDGETLGSYAWKGVDGANSNAAAEASIVAIAAEDHSGSTAATHLAFNTKPTGTGPGSAPTENMRLDSGGNLDLVQSNHLRWKHQAGGTIRGSIDADSNDNLMFYTGSSESERMRIDGSGRLLVASSTAVTGTTTAKLQINGTDNAGSTMSIGRFSANANAPTLQFIKSRNGTVGGNTIVQDGDNLGQISFAASDGSDTVTLAAKIFCEVDGTPGSNDMPGRLTFFTTADGASSPTERMRIDSLGNVGIGVTPSSEFHVKGDAATVARVEPNSNSGKATLLVSSAGSGDGGMQYDANTNNMHLFSYSNMTFNVGTTNISGNYPANERMRIDSSGDVMIGNTTVNPASAHSDQKGFGFDTSLGSLEVAAIGGSAAVFGLNQAAATDVVVFRKQGTQRGSVGITDSGTSFNTSSDARLKTVLGKAEGLEIVNKLNPVNFEWNESKEIQDGLIAQEVMEIIPHAVSKNSDDYYEMDYSRVVTPLIKAIQEQQEQIDALQSEINLLKGE
jgi:cytoskeletal protein CcmA (bactofilin family)